MRTFNSEKVLPGTLEALRRQTVVPSEYVFVDSGSTDATLRAIPDRAKVHRYKGPVFNYAEAINQGLKHVSTEYVLILSAHTTLSNKDALAFGLRLLNSDASVGAVYFDTKAASGLRVTLITKHNFDGFNGLWNTCALVRMDLLKCRAFRPEVFAAEDQEWASWLVGCRDMAIARVSGAGMDNYSRNAELERRHTTDRKRLNEYVAIAYFANTELLKGRQLLRVAWQVVKPGSARLSERRFHFVLLKRLIACHFAVPGYRF